MLDSDPSSSSLRYNLVKLVPLRIVDDKNNLSWLPLKGCSDKAELKQHFLWSTLPRNNIALWLDMEDSRCQDLVRDISLVQVHNVSVVVLGQSSDMKYRSSAAMEFSEELKTLSASIPSADIYFLNHRDNKFIISQGNLRQSELWIQKNTSVDVFIRKEKDDFLRTILYFQLQL